MFIENKQIACGNYCSDVIITDIRTVTIQYSVLQFCGNVDFSLLAGVLDFQSPVLRNQKRAKKMSIEGTIPRITFYLNLKNVYIIAAKRFKKELSGNSLSN